MKEFLTQVEQPQSEAKENATRNGRIIIITGPTGVGKDMVMQELLKDEELNAKRIVTYTTRQPRTNEVDGVDYNFITDQQFEELIKNDQLAEKKKYGSTWKGTPRAPFTEVLEGGNFIWRIDPSRAADINDFYIETFGEEQGKILQERTTVLYLGVSSLRTIYDRSKNRAQNEGSEFDKAEFKQRLVQDWTDWNKYKDKFSNVVFNDGSIEDTVKNAKEIIFSSTPKNI